MKHAGTKGSASLDTDRRLPTRDALRSTKFVPLSADGAGVRLPLTYIKAKDSHSSLR